MPPVVDQQSTRPHCMSQPVATKKPDPFGRATIGTSDFYFTSPHSVATIQYTTPTRKCKILLTQDPFLFFGEFCSRVQTRRAVSTSLPNCEMHLCRCRHSRCSADRQFIKNKKTGSLHKASFDFATFASLLHNRR